MLIFYHLRSWSWVDSSVVSFLYLFESLYFSQLAVYLNLKDVPHSLDWGFILTGTDISLLCHILPLLLPQLLLLLFTFIILPFTHLIVHFDSNRNLESFASAKGESITLIHFFLSFSLHLLLILILLQAQCEYLQIPSLSLGSKSLESSYCLSIKQHTH